MKTSVAFVCLLFALFAVGESREANGGQSVCFTYSNCTECASNEECFYCSVNNGIGHQGRCLPLDSTDMCPTGYGTATSVPQCDCINNSNCTSCSSAGCSWCDSTLTCGGKTLATCTSSC